jgi:capsular polysaccharide biosynthesis protein
MATTRLVGGVDDAAPMRDGVLGAGAALGREFLDRSVHDTRALQHEFEVPVLGEIPRITA